MKTQSRFSRAIAMSHFMGILRGSKKKEIKVVPRVAKVKKLRNLTGVPNANLDFKHLRQREKNSP